MVTADYHCESLGININVINPYQPSGSRPRELQSEPNAKIGLGSFLVWQFLAYVPTLFVLRSVLLWFDNGWQDAYYVLGNNALIFAAIMVWCIATWLPHALYAVLSSRVRCGGGALSGIVGGASVAVGMSIAVMVFEIAPIQISSWLDGLPLYVEAPAYLFLSLIAVTVLGHIRSKPIAATTICAEPSET